MKELIDFIARTLAEEPDEVEVTETDGGRQIQLRLAADDVGRLIGRRGRTAKALRVLLESGPQRFRLDIDAHGADEPDDDDDDDFDDDDDLDDDDEEEDDDFDDDDDDDDDDGDDDE